MDRRQLLLGQWTHTINFSIEADWLHCFGLRLFDLTWQLNFSVWVTTWPKEGIEQNTRRNPTEALRLRLADEGFLTTFFGDEFAQSLVERVPTVNLADLMEAMKMIAADSFDEYSVPIVLLD